MTDIPLTAPAADRNKAPILAVLAEMLPPTGLVVEIASGTGQHVVHFAETLTGLVWQPSDPDWTMRESIRAWIATTNLPNLRDPLDIDVRSTDWPLEQADAVLCINMIHIAPLAATAGLMAGASRLLGPDGRLVLYGPFRRAGRPTAPTNEAFDAMLRSQNLDWGLRDLDAVKAAAESHGLALRDVIEMPANNLMVLFEAGASEARPPDAATTQIAARAAPSGPAPAGLDDALLQWLVRAPNLTDFMAQDRNATANAPQPGPQGVSLMITRAQRVQLQAMGFSDEAIGRMTPAAAHAHLAVRS